MGQCQERTDSEHCQCSAVSAWIVFTSDGLDGRAQTRLDPIRTDSKRVARKSVCEVAKAARALRRMVLRLALRNRLVAVVDDL